MYCDVSVVFLYLLYDRNPCIQIAPFLTSRSVASAAHNRRKSVITPKLKTKLGRGYNPSLVNYKDSEYHYGSDFDDDDEDEREEQVSVL